MKRLNWLAVAIWLAVGVYGIFYNITYIDEAKYLIKGWLITTGQIGYYSTPEFFYQHLPGGFLWYGFGQKIFGPNLLIARVQSFVLGLVILWLSWLVVKKIKPAAAGWVLPIMILAPVATLYYSSAVPQSLAAVFLLTGFLGLFSKRFYLATLGFTLAFISRENFLFTLIFYFGFLFYYRKEVWLKNSLVAAVIAGLFFLPGWPGIGKVLTNFPGITWLLPVSSAEKNILGLNIQQPTHSLSLYLQAAKEFGEIYFVFILVFIWSLLQKKFYGRRFLFLIFIAGFNFLAHAWSAGNLTPRAIVPYFAYVFPLLAVITSVNLANKKIKFYWLLLLLALAGMPLAGIFGQPGKLNTIKRLSVSAQNLKPVVADKPAIIWIAEPMSLYLTGRVSYYPLINHTNFYKPSAGTATIKSLGFWNEAMLGSWLDEADLLVVDPNRLNFAGINLGEKLNHSWQPIAAPENIWPEQLVFYAKSSSTR